MEDMPVSPPQSRPSPSPFLTPPQHTDRLVASIEAELKRLQRRRLFSESHGSHMTSQSAKDQPIFTLKQVTLVCQKMLKEREEDIRKEYDGILSNKLSGIKTITILLLLD
jgi:hypothetical protein